MLIKSITNGSVSSTGTITCESGIVGGILLTTDNTNAAVVELRRNSASGKKILQVSTVTSMWISGPFSLEETTQLYYSITGTGAAGQVFEWIY